MATATEHRGERLLALPHFPKQIEFLRAAEPYVALVTGVGGGKTRAGAAKALMLCIAHPGILGMVTAPTYKMLSDATVRTLFEVWPQEFAGPGNLNKGEMHLRCANGSEILFRSTEDPETLRGPNLGFFWMDEGAQSPLLAWQILQGRLRQADMPHCGWVTTTPQGYNWVYQEFDAKHRADYRLIQYSARDNFFLPPDFIRRLEESYKDDFALQEIEGRFVITSGACYFQVPVLKDYLAVAQPPLDSGPVHRWQKAIVGRNYVMGVDCAEGLGADNSAAIVVDWQTGQEVAEICGNYRPDELARLVFDLASEYNKAMLGVERQGPGLAVLQKLAQLHYPRLYNYRPDVPGWLTDSGTRPVMLAELEEAVRQRTFGIMSRALLDEMFSFVRIKTGRVQAAEGAHDDRVMAAAIAWQMRHQPGSSGGFRPFVVRDGKRMG